MDTRTVMWMLAAAIAAKLVIDDGIRSKAAQPMRLAKTKSIRLASPHRVRGVVFGKVGRRVCYSPHDAEGHIAVFGGSGTGKTSAVLIPTLKAWPGTALVVDIAGDISRECVRAGDVLLSPDNPGAGYDVMRGIDMAADDAERYEQAQQLARLLLPDPEPGASDAERFYRDGGRRIITAALLAFRGRDFCDICETIALSSWRDLFRGIDAAGCADASGLISAYEGTAEQSVAGCKQTADAAVELYAFGTLRSLLHRPAADAPTVTPQTLEAASLYLSIPDSRLTYYAPLLRLISGQCLAYLSGREVVADTPPVLLCLDELASLGKLELLDALRKYRKRRVRVLMLTQSIADLDLVYTERERRAMLDNCRYVVVLSASDPDTQEYLARRIGQQLTQRGSITRSGGHVSHTLADAKDYSVDPASLAVLGEELLLLYPEGYRRLRKAYYYKQ